MITIEQIITNNQWLFLLAVLWSIPWKGIALWKSAHRKEKWWFITLLVVNTFGLLEILYIFVFSKKKEEKKEENEENERKEEIISSKVG